MRNGSKPCRLRPVGRISGVRRRSPPSTGRMKRPVERAQQRRQFGSSREEPLAMASWCSALDVLASRRCRRPRAARRGAPSTAPRWRRARAVAAVDASAIARSMSARSLAEAGSPTTCSPPGSACTRARASPAVSVEDPGAAASCAQAGSRGRQFQRGRLRLDQRGESLALGPSPRRPSARQLGRANPSDRAGPDTGRRARPGGVR